MKKINKIKNLLICSSIAMGGMLTSCNDWLTLYPVDRIVEENFWEDKNDLESVRAAAYLNMTKSLKRFMVWGEYRSDNFEQNSSNTNSDLRNLMNANLRPDAGWFTWGGFYTTINYCNKVLEHGEEIVEKDQSFTEGDWLPIKTEMVTLRALNYFYLVRSFGDRVPLVLESINDDSQAKPTPASTQIEVLDEMIKEVEAVKDYGMVDFGNTTENKGRITKKAAYALLADMYLWKAAKHEGPSEGNGISTANPDFDLEKANAAYSRAIECCDSVISIMKVENTTGSSGNIFVPGVGSSDETNKENIYNLAENSEEGTSKQSSAYNAIFGTGNSKESIFELQYDNSNKNSGDWYATDGALETKEITASQIFQTNGSSVDAADKVFYKTDVRKWESMVNTTNNKFCVAKYGMSYISQDPKMLLDNTKTEEGSNSLLTQTVNTNLTANWIFYRLSEILLIKAEALSRINEDMSEPFNLVREVYKRSNPRVYAKTASDVKKDSLVSTNYDTKEKMEALIMRERQREFFGEGKRWYDLVRYAQRRNSTKDMLDLLVRKYVSGKDGIRAKLNSMNTLFCPISESEIKANAGVLEQNPAWDTSNSISKN